VLMSNQLTNPVINILYKITILGPYIVTGIEMI
jgi:hypothetical protein